MWCVLTLWPSMNIMKKYKMLLFKNEGKGLARLILAEICKMEPYFICSSCLKLLFTRGFVSSCIGNNFTKKNSLKTTWDFIKGPREKERLIWQFSWFAEQNALVMLFLNFSCAYFKFCISYCICFSSPYFLPVTMEKRLPWQQFIFWYILYGTVHMYTTFLTSHWQTWVICSLTVPNIIYNYF